MTARALLHHCREAGITLAGDADGITFDAPPGVAVPVDDIRQAKPELRAVLNGDYLNAALAMLLNEPDPDRREALAEAFDERAGICQYDGNMSRGEAERQAYIELARAVVAMEGGAA